MRTQLIVKVLNLYFFIIRGYSLIQPQSTKKLLRSFRKYFLLFTFLHNFSSFYSSCVFPFWCLFIYYYFFLCQLTCMWNFFFFYLFVKFNSKFAARWCDMNGQYSNFIWIVCFLMFVWCAQSQHSVALTLLCMHNFTLLRRKWLEV